VRIASTLRLDEFAVSESLVDDVQRDARLALVSGPADPPFDAEGNLTDLNLPKLESEAREPALVAAGG
jgi:hypothetical protein